MKTLARVRAAQVTNVVAVLPDRFGPHAVMRRTAFELVVCLTNLNRL